MQNDDYRIVVNPGEMDLLLAELDKAPVIALDLETSGFEGDGYGGPSDNIVGWALAVRPEQAWYIPVAHASGVQFPGDVVAQALKPLLERQDKTYVIHNAKFDTNFIRAVGIGIPYERIEDSMLEASIAGFADRLTHVGLKYIEEQLWHVTPVTFESLFPPKTKNKNIANVDYDKAGYYACADADYCLRVHTRYSDYITTHPKLATVYALERALWPLTQKIENTGVFVNVDYVDTAVDFLRAEAAKLYGIIVRQMMAKDPAFDPTKPARQKLKKGEEDPTPWIIGFNPSSSQQRGEVLFEYLGLPVVGTTATGRPSTGKLTLDRLSKLSPEAKNIEAYASILGAITKLRKEIKGSIKYDGRAHTNYNQVGARSGRYSSSAPNFQNIAREKVWEAVDLDGEPYEVKLSLRDAFTARPGYYLLEFDFSAIEFIIMAKLAGDEAIVDAYNKGLDVHRQTASDMFNLTKDLSAPFWETEEGNTYRDRAKTCNYLIIYGGTGMALSLRTGQTPVEADQEINRFLQVRPRFKKFSDHIIDMARQDTPNNPYATVETVFGRKIFVPELFSVTVKEKRRGERSAVNGVVQGTAAEYHKVGLLRSDMRMGENFTYEAAKMILQTHDSQAWEISQVFQPHAIVELVEEAMHTEHRDLPNVKVDAKIGFSYGSMAKYKPETDYLPIFAKFEEEYQKKIDSLRTLTHSIAAVGSAGAQNESNKVGVQITVPGGADASNENLVQLASLLAAYPGENVVILTSVNGSDDIVCRKTPTSLGAKTLSELLQPIMPGTKAIADRSLLLDAVAGSF